VGVWGESILELSEKESVLMSDLSQQWSPYAYALMRVVVGLVFLCHGLSKLVHFPVPPPSEVPPLLIYTAGPIELVCGTLVALGLLTRGAAFLASGEMAVGYFMAHFPRGFFPLANGGELAVLYCFAFLFISAHGAGSWSVDELRKRRPSRAL
jgi:putative oxidoreductase